MDQLLLIDKPAGMTSHDVVNRIRRIFNTRRVGHAGTLDPFATGLLILGVGTATKQLTALVGLDKVYEATARLGATSDTFDTEGVITETSTLTYTTPTPDDIERALAAFRGEFDQKAPLFSAKKLKGQKLYDLARKGLATEDMRPVKRVTIFALECIDYTWPKLRFRVHCSSGTYIRSLADDIGRTLGCGAYLTGLRRLSIGPHSLENAKNLEALISSVRLDNPHKA